MEWTDKLKREVNGSQSRGPTWWIVILIFIVALFLLLVDVGVAKEAHAGGGDMLLSRQILEAEQDQAKYLKKIADELHRMRIKMEK